MNDPDKPPQRPTPQRSGAGGPPKPPPVAAQRFDGDGEEHERRMRALFEFQRGREDTARLVEILWLLRQSRWQVAINKLEADLDVSVVAASKGGNLPPEVLAKLSRRALEDALRYRISFPRALTGDGAVREEAQRILDELTPS